MKFYQDSANSIVVVDEFDNTLFTIIVDDDEQWDTIRNMLVAAGIESRGAEA